jgi:hypothetical protein
VVELSYAEIFIGRSMECAVRTDDPMVSRRHARIYFQDGRHIIEDLGSANGVFVADVRTQMHVLNDGDSVRCGNLWLQYASDGMMASPGGFGVPPSMDGMGGGATSYGGGAPGGYPPPPVAGYPGAPGLPGTMGGPPPAGPPPAAPMAGIGGMGGPPPPVEGGPITPAEITRMQRRIDQLQSEVRILRGGGDAALRMEELEEKVSRLERDKSELEEKCTRLELMGRQGGGGGVQIGTAQLMLGRVEEVVNGLNDVLSELRINVLAAEGESEQWSQTLPRASYDLVRESLRACRIQMEQARELMRLLRAEARR